MKPFLIFLLISIHLWASHAGDISPFIAPTGSIALLLLGRQIWPDTWKTWLGVGINTRHLISLLILLPISLSISYYLIRFIATTQHRLYEPSIINTAILDPFHFHTIGRTFNEELIIGALLLNALKKPFSRHHPLLISVTVALVFSLMHYAFFDWIISAKNEGVLTLNTLWVLFAVGVLRNSLILSTGHIGDAWILHLSYNLFFLGQYDKRSPALPVKEVEMFNMILGSQTMGFLAIFLLLLGVWIQLNTQKDG